MRIRGQSAIDIQIDENGYIVLRPDGDEGEQAITFAPAYASKVAAAIAELQDFAQKKFEKQELEEV
jgi:hypothetical protein